MTTQLSDEEKKAKADAHDALIKHVFDNIRNLLISVTLAAAGGAVLRFRADLLFGSEFNLIIGIIVLLTSFGLFLWNMFHGAEKLSRPVKGTWKAWRKVPFFVVYMLAFFAIFQALVRAQAEQQLRVVNTKPTPNISVERDASPKSGSRPSP